MIEDISLPFALDDYVDFLFGLHTPLDEKTLQLFAKAGTPISLLCSDHCLSACGTLGPAQLGSLLQPCSCGLSDVSDLLWSNGFQGPETNMRSESSTLSCAFMSL